MVSSSKTASLELWYRRIARISIGAVLFLILVGGIVRSTGSGMGCPDWPKCFGLLVPPSRVEDIPQAFFEKHPQFEAKTFNAFQTWTEYVNRLVGATIGLLMFLTTLLSLVFIKRDLRIFLLSLGAMLLTGFEAWLGKLVVDKNLEGGMVTLHMLVAMVIVAMLILSNYLVAARHKLTGETPKAGTSRLAWIGFGVIVFTIAQVLIGTQVRETVDGVALSGVTDRSLWLQPSMWFTLHKVAWMVMAAVVALWIRTVLQQLSGNRMVRWLAWSVVGFMGLEIALGVILANMDLPPVAQPLHMLVANLIFAAEFSIWIHVIGVERMFAKGKKEEALQAAHA
ncbi:MAG: COX15/CtaA family protein [Bacteroidia bacterium]